MRWMLGLAAAFWIWHTLGGVATSAGGQVVASLARSAGVSGAVGGDANLVALGVPVATAPPLSP